MQSLGTVMKKILLRIFDENIRTNYIERRIDCDDVQQAFELISSDEDAQLEVEKKFLKNKDMQSLIENNYYEYMEI